jgi:c-di-AMP phosphodiesterase-like protein
MMMMMMMMIIIIIIIIIMAKNREIWENFFLYIVVPFSFFASLCPQSANGSANNSHINPMQEQHTDCQWLRTEFN